jgi:LEA14-like dessication related protein
MLAIFKTSVIAITGQYSGLEQACIRKSLSRFLLVLIASAVLAGCASLPSVLEKPKMEFAGVRIDSLDLSKPELTVILRLTNPNSVSLPIKTVELKCDVSGKPFAEGRSLQAIDLPARGNTLMELHLSIHKEGLNQMAKDMLFHPNDPVKYHLFGHATLTQLELRSDFEFIGTTDLPQLLGRKKN